MISIALCDDNSYELSKLMKLIEQYQQKREVQLLYTCFPNAKELLHHPKYSEFDIYLLDVLMPDLNGINLAKILRNNGVQGIIVFLTFSKDFALEAFQVKAFSYLLKPLDPKDLFDLLDDCMERQPVPKSISVALSDGNCCVPLHKLLYVEHDRHVCIYHMVTGEIIRGKTIRVSFPQAMEGLLSDNHFLMPHQSFVLNMEHVFRMNTTEFIMVDHTIIPISRRRATQAKAKYLTYLSSQTIY